MLPDRREFLHRLTVSGMALGTLPAMLGASSSSDVADSPVDRSLRRVSQPTPTDVSWTRRLTGKHKAVFDSPDIESGYGVLRAGIVASQYAEVFKLAPGDFSAVIVLRHTGISLAMNQAYWTEYKIGATKKVLHPVTEKPTDRNPALLTEADGMPPQLASYALDKAIARGVVVLACALAFGDVVDLIAKTDKRNAEDAAAKARSLMIPGVIMQPSGVFATTLAQESGCVYVRAT
jgi:hypothetical protein